jgi:hypothetical protein
VRSPRELEPGRWRVEQEREKALRAKRRARAARERRARREQAWHTVRRVRQQTVARLRTLAKQVLGSTAGRASH